MNAMKNILIILSLFLSTSYLFAQSAEVVQDEVRTTPYQGRSYIVVKSLTIRPPANGSFQVNASVNGSFYIKMADAVVNYSTTVPPSQDQNYVRTEAILQTGVTDENQIANLDVKGKAISYEYIDGISRSKQIVAVQGSPLQKDFVEPVVFDANGRQSIQYLPYAGATQDGSFHSNPISEQSSFYSNATRVSTDSRPFSEYTFENSALNRVTQAFGPGSSWYADSKKSLANYEIYTNVLTRWDINSSGLPEAITTYPANTIYYQTALDEDSNSTTSYYDLRGLLVRKTVNGLTTCNVYDEFGNIRFVIPPALSSVTSPSQVQLDNFAFQYGYDSRQRLIKKKSPGPDNDWVYTIFDQWDRPVFTQDGVQRSKTIKEWSFIKYDALNRPIMTGVIQNNNTFDQMLASLTGAHHEDRVPGAVGYTLTNSSPSITESSILTLQYYDDYVFLNYPGWDAEGNSYSLDAGLTNLTSVKGRTTGTKIKVLDQNKWLNSVTYYDKKYREIESIEENNMGGLDKYILTYNFPGWITQGKRIHTTSIASTTIIENYEYDHRGRLLKVYNQIDSNPTVLLASYSYNEIGERVEKNLHSTDGGNTFLQSVDYRYNIRGALTSINNAKLNVDTNNDDSNDLFGMEFIYNQSQVGVNGTNTTKRYNGSLSAVKWKTDNKKDLPKERVYGYNYDAKSRLLSGRYAAFNGTTYADEAGFYDLENLNYDDNGNLLSLKRYAKSGSTRVPIDDLTYQYGSNGNQLTGVSDAGNSLGFKNSTNLTTEFQYDKNANVTSDLNNDMVSITYNYLNLPSQIVIDAAGTTNDYIVEYTYDATGYVLRKVLKKSGTIVGQIDYVNGIQYVNSQLAYIFTSEGRVYKTGSGYEYEYFLKDHQGNTRLAFGWMKDTKVYKAGMEPTNAQQEEADFQNVASRRVYSGTVNHTAPSATVPSPAYTAIVKAHNLATENAMGPAKMLTVKQGDQVSLEAYAITISGTGGNPTTIGGIAGIVAASFGIVNAGETQAAYNAFQNFIPGFSASFNSGSLSVPKAYLCYVLFNSTYTAAQFGYQVIDYSAFNQWKRLAVQATVPYDGYMYVYVANESTISECYFDDVQIIHQKAALALNVTASADYDPLGYMLNGTRYKDPSRYSLNYLFQGDFSEQDETSGWNRFALRGNYDSRLGRWYSTDPYNQFASPFVGMGNDFVNGVDFDGGLFGGGGPPCPECEELRALGYNVLDPVKISGQRWMESAFGNGLGLMIGGNFNVMPKEQALYNEYDIKYPKSVLGKNSSEILQSVAPEMPAISHDAEYAQMPPDRMDPVAVKYRTEVAQAMGRAADIEMQVLLSIGAVEYIAGRALASTLPVLFRAAKGVSVIGPRSTYREFAKKIGANFLDVTDEAWTMRKNVEFLQGVVKRGDDVIFSGKFNPAKLDPNSVLGQEIRYLTRHGYSWTDDFSRMIKK